MEGREGLIFPKWVPGFLLLFMMAFISKIIGNYIPLLGSVVIAILLGVLTRNFLVVKEIYEEGINFVVKTILKLAIILLGVSLSLNQIVQIGSQSFIIILMVVLSGILLTIVFGKLLKIDDTLGLMIGFGTSICGATAITVLKGVIHARETQTAYAISTIFFFNLIATLSYPWIGHSLNLDATSFGIWTGTAIHDTSSVVAVGYMYGDEAGDIATTVKLVRTLFIIPIVLIIAFLFSRKVKRENEANASDFKPTKLSEIFPWFILGFVFMSLLNSAGVFETETKDGLVSILKFLIIMVMVGVGLQVKGKEFMSLGLKPILTGLFASVCVSGISLAMIYLLVN